MTVLPLVISPDPRLKQKSEPVEKVDDELRIFMNDMLETMYASHGIGLAAVQVGVLKRIMVVDVGNRTERYEDLEDSEPNPIFFINPEIIESSDDTQDFDEGCLSFPGQYASVTRPQKIKIKYLDYHGKEQILEADGIQSICIQHEMDHLDGIVFVDHISKIKKDMILRKMKKLQKQNA